MKSGGLCLARPCSPTGFSEAWHTVADSPPFCDFQQVLTPPWRSRSTSTCTLVWLYFLPIPFNFLSFFFPSSGDGTQGLPHARQGLYTGLHPSFFCAFCASSLTISSRLSHQSPGHVRKIIQSARDYFAFL
jgi:hypothetical protein